MNKISLITTLDFEPFFLYTLSQWYCYKKLFSSACMICFGKYNGLTIPLAGGESLNVDGKSMQNEEKDSVRVNGWNWLLLCLFFLKNFDTQGLEGLLSWNWFTDLKLWGEATGTQLWQCKMEAAGKTGLVLHCKQKGFEEPHTRVNKCSWGKEQPEFPNEYFIVFQATVSPKLSSLFSLKTDWPAAELCWEVLTELYQLLIVSKILC